MPATTIFSEGSPRSILEITEGSLMADQVCRR